MKEVLVRQLLLTHHAITLVAPEEHLLKEGKQLFSSRDVILSSVAMQQQLSCYLFPDQQSSLYESAALVKCLREKPKEAEKLLALYDLLKNTAFKKQSFKTLMRESGIRNFYTLRSYVSWFCSLGLFIPLSVKGQRWPLLLSFFYEGTEPIILILRHLLNQGFSVSLERVKEVYVTVACREKEHFVLAYGNEEAVIALWNKREEKRFLITPKEVVLPFPFLTVLSLRAFLHTIFPL